jgi:hypothetical protein
MRRLLVFLCRQPLGRLGGTSTSRGPRRRLEEVGWIAVAEFIPRLKRGSCPTSSKLRLAAGDAARAPGGANTAASKIVTRDAIARPIRRPEQLPDSTLAVLFLSGVRIEALERSLRRRARVWVSRQTLRQAPETLRAVSDHFRRWTLRFSRAHRPGRISSSPFRRSGRQARRNNGLSRLPATPRRAIGTSGHRPSRWLTDGRRARDSSRIARAPSFAGFA